MRPKTLKYSRPPLAQVGLDLGALQAAQRVAQELVAPARGLTVGGNQQIARLEAEAAVDGAPLVQSGDALRDAVDQHVAVVDGREAVSGRRDLDPVVAALVATRLHVRLGREREDRMLHRGHVALGGGVDDVADEEVPLGVAVGQERRAISHAAAFVAGPCERASFVTSHTGGRERGWRVFVTSHTLTGCG